VTSVFDGSDRLVSRTKAGARPERAGTTLYSTESFSYDGLGQEMLRQGADIDVATKIADTCS
jgi:hypothetical protein